MSEYFISIPNQSKYDFYTVHYCSRVECSNGKLRDKMQISTLFFIVHNFKIRKTLCKMKFVSRLMLHMFV